MNAMKSMLLDIDVREKRNALSQAEEVLTFKEHRLVESKNVRAGR